MKIILKNEYNLIGNDSIQMSRIDINPEYAKKWNVNPSLNDFIVLSKNGSILRDTLYRVGGMGSPNLEQDDYFMLIKHVEAYYDDSITKDPDRKRHLENRWVILDKQGNELVECKPYEYPYMVKNSILYSVDRKYYNLKTGFYYGNANKWIESKDYIFLDVCFDKEVKEGVYKIHKKTGEFEFFPEK